MSGHAPGRGGAWAFFGLTLVLTLPIWLAGGLSGIQLLPGLPLAAVAVVCPALAALTLSLSRDGRAAAWALLRRSLDLDRLRPRVWWLVVLGLPPAVDLIVWLLQRRLGLAVPRPSFNLVEALVLAAVFLPSAVFEELGWTGFALQRLQPGWRPLPAALLIGFVWALWHYPALVQAHRSPAWIAGWTLDTLAVRVILVWIYNRAGASLAAVAVMHAASNLCWQLYPLHGSYYDPRLHGLILAAVAGAAVVSGLGPRHLVPAAARPPT